MGTFFHRLPLLGLDSDAIQKWVELWSPGFFNLLVGELVGVRALEILDDSLDCNFLVLLFFVIVAVEGGLNVVLLMVEKGF